MFTKDSYFPSMPIWYPGMITLLIRPSVPMKRYLGRFELGDSSITNLQVLAIPSIEYITIHLPVVDRELITMIA